MSEDQNQSINDVQDVADDIPKPDELAMLKSRARMMGVTFSNNISIPALKQKIEDHLAGNKEKEAAAPAPLADPENASLNGKKLSIRDQVRRENLRLIRVRITNLDPKKKDLPGEVITVANEYLGTVRKFVPYGEVTEDGYHIPYCIYKALKARKFLNIRTTKDRKNNNQIKIEQNWAQEFAIEVLPQLTREELKQLATAQLASGSVG